MIRSRASVKSAHSAFTLIEMVIVIAIIAILIALLVPAVMNILAKREQVQNFDEIYQIGVAIGECKTGLHLDQIPPGPFNLKSAYASTDPELSVLLRAFPQLNTSNTGLPNVTLDSNQTLLFFLTGGTVTNFNGFSTNPTQPFAVGNPGDSRKGPYLKLTPQFYSTSPRDSAGTAVLKSTTSNSYNYISGSAVSYTVAAGGTQAWLVDAFGEPLAYFAAINGKSGLYYAPPSSTAMTITPVSALPTTPTAMFQSYQLNYTNGVSTIVYPYISPSTFPNPTAFLNPTAYQIISAGRNLEFGPGWNVLPATLLGKDDQANFSKVTLGAGIE
jgi:prepilin-type N-terminal cleavage/methylation domain-containing protein